MSTNKHSGDAIPIDDIIAALTALREEYQAEANRADATERWTLLMGKESGVWAAIAAIRDLQLESLRERLGIA